MNNNTQRETTVQGVLEGMSSRDIVLVSLALQRFLVCAHEYTASNGKAEKDWFQSPEHAENAGVRGERLSGIMFEASIAAAQQMLQSQEAIA